MHLQWCLVMENERPRVSFDVALIIDDMGRKGWMGTDLARETGLSNKTISLFLRNICQTPKTAKKIAFALGKPLTRYLISSEAVA
jgi:transcriptional regulator with XRE-family HTH domain